MSPLGYHLLRRVHEGGDYHGEEAGAGVDRAAPSTPGAEVIYAPQHTLYISLGVLPTRTKDRSGAREIGLRRRWLAAPPVVRALRGLRADPRRKLLCVDLAAPYSPRGR